MCVRQTQETLVFPCHRSSCQVLHIWNICKQAREARKPPQRAAEGRRNLWLRSSQAGGRGGSAEPPQGAQTPGVQAHPPAASSWKPLSTPGHPLRQLRGGRILPRTRCLLLQPYSHCASSLPQEARALLALSVGSRSFTEPYLEIAPLTTRRFLNCYKRCSARCVSAERSWFGVRESARC